MKRRKKSSQAQVHVYSIPDSPYFVINPPIPPFSITDNIEKYYSVDDYEGEEDDEISFPEGAVVDVLQKRLDGWWLVRYEDQTGLAPGTFLRKAQTDLVNFSISNRQQV